MARVVRKVSNKAVKGQKRERKGLLFSKKFWIIIISIVVVLAAAGITIGIIVANNNKTSEAVTVDDYFGQTQKYKDTDIDVNFTKMTYEGVVLHTNPESELANDYTFVFAADLSTFYPFELIDTNNDNTDLKNSKHTQIFNLLVELQYTIDTFKAKADYKVALYVVDTKVQAGNSSAGIYTSSKFNPDSTDDSSFAGPLFCLLSVDGLQKTVPNGTANLYATSYTTSNEMATAIDNAIKFVNSL